MHRRWMGRSNRAPIAAPADSPAVSPAVVLLATVALTGCGVLAESTGSDRGAGTEGAEPVGDGTGTAVEVVRLSDGDSGVLAIDGEDVEFRLLGYNAPERFEGDGGPRSCNGDAAERALDEALASGPGPVRFIGTETDRYGRLLGDFVVDGRPVVADLVADGRGLATGEEARRDLMREAAAAARGLWGDGCGRPAADGLEVDRVEPDPPGRDEEDLNGEYVELVNRGPATVDLTGWDIRDDSSSHRFDLVGRLDPGERLVVRTGSGSTGDGELFLGSPSPVWSNRGDTVLVIDPDGVVAAWAFVDS